MVKTLVGVKKSPLLGFSYLGIMPGSEKEVRNKFDMTKMNKTAPTTGMAGLTFVVRNGQSKAKNKLEVVTIRIIVR